MVRRVPPAEKVLEDLGSSLAKLEDAISTGFDRYFSHYPAAIRLDHSPSVQAACIHSHIMARAREVFDGVKGAKVQTVRGLELISLLHARYVLKIKKLDCRGYGANIETHQTLCFDSQEQLEGIPERSLYLRAGYLTDRANTRIELLLLACPSGGDVAWLAKFGHGGKGLSIPPAQPSLIGGPEIQVRAKKQPPLGNVVPLKRRKNGI